MRHLRRGSEHDLLHHHVVEALEGVQHVVQVGVGLGRVLANHVQRRQLAGGHRANHLGEVLAVRRLQRHAPVLLEAGANRGVLDLLEAGELVRNRAHVAAPLHVVLAAQRVEAAPAPPDVPGEETEVDQREHVVHRVVMFGDAQGPADHRLVGAREGVRGLANDVGGDAGEPCPDVEGVRLDRGAIGVEAGGGVRDEADMMEAGVNDLARHRVGEGNVGADMESHPDVGPLGGGRAPGVDDVEPRPVPDPLEQVMEPDRVGFARIRAPEEHHIGLLDFLIRAGPAARAERCRQTDDTRSVSRSVAGIDVVRAEGDAGELLREEVHLVGGLRAREDAEGIRAVRRAIATEAVGGRVEGIVPRCRAKDAAGTHQRLGQAVVGARSGLAASQGDLLQWECGRTE